MGYDLYGEKPTAPEGEYFRRNIWRWPEMVALCEEVAPQESRPCKYWYGEDCPGHGLNAEQSVKLAAKLDTAISSGQVAALLNAVREPGCDENDMREFVAFLKSCGGFHIS